MSVRRERSVQSAGTGCQGVDRRRFYGLGAFGQQAWTGAEIYRRAEAVMGNCAPERRIHRSILCGHPDWRV